VCQRCLSRGLICRFSERETRVRSTSKARQKRTVRGNTRMEQSSRPPIAASAKTYLLSKPVLQSGAPLRPSAGLTARVLEQPQQVWRETPQSHDSSKVQDYSSFALSGIQGTPTSMIFPALPHHVTPSAFEDSGIPFTLFDPYMQAPMINLDLGRQNAWNRPADHVSE
jgi:hypothetical protein